MRVLLVSPPMFNVATLFMSRLVNISMKYPNLGLLYVAASLRKSNPECEIKFIDSWDFKKSVEEIRPIIERYKPDVVGISTTTSSLYDTVRIAQIAKSIDSKIHVTIGGYHLYLYPRETISLEFVDSVVVGEGELTFAELVGRLERGESLEGVAGVLYKKNGDVYCNPERPPIKDLDSLPYPARDLLSRNQRYTFSTDPEVNAASILSSRGCPFRCVFCCNPLGYYHLRSVSNVVEEMIHCRDIGYKAYNFVDENFNVNLERTKKLADAIIDAGLNLPWSFRGRVDNFDEELAEKLARAKCYRINFGVESGNDEVLKLMNKQATVEDARRAFRLARKYKISTVAYFIIGFPGETDQQIEDTIKFALELKPDYAQFNVPLIFPKTQLYYKAIERGLLDEEYYLSFVRNPYKGFTIPIWCGERSEKELLNLQSVANRRFYLRPKYIWERIKEVKSFREFLKKALFAIYLFYYMLTRKKA